MPLPTATLVQERWRTKYKHSYMIRIGPFGLPWWWSQVLRCLQYFLFSILKIKTYTCKYEVKLDLSNVQIVWNLGVTSVWVMGEKCDSHPKLQQWMQGATNMIRCLSTHQVSSCRWLLLWWVCTVSLDMHLRFVFHQHTGQLHWRNAPADTSIHNDWWKWLSA